MATALAIVMGLVAVGIGVSQFFPAIFGARPTIPVTGGSPSAATISASRSALQSPTSPSAVPTSTPIPTSTALPQTHALEVPFELDGHAMLLHRLDAGDQFERIDAEYDTTPAVVRALNSSVRASLLTNVVIVIAPGLQVVDPALPSFMVREVDRPAATIDDLAQEYHVEAAVLGHYNGCIDVCSFVAGDWILIPVIDESTAAP